ncbi:MAG: ABC transporter permease [Gemmatimonadaceae bacterium]|nr:ABC transporter permease [Gemmatimonadaceae bacterium]
MIAFLFRRLLQGVAILVTVATVTFVLIHAAPGEPFAGQLDDVRFTPAMQAELRRQRGLDQPLATQYVRYMGRLARGDLDVSLAQQRPVRTILAEALPRTLLLMSAALFGGFALGIVVGALQAARAGSWADRVAGRITVALAALPDFWLALTLLLLFSVRLRWFPVSGLVDPTMHEYLSPLGRLRDVAWHLALPATTMALIFAAVVARYQRQALLDVLPDDFVRSARAKGVSERGVVLRHALRNALLPTITLFGMALPALVGGSLFVEFIFAWPGMGRAAVEALSARDYPVVLGTTLVSSALVVVGSIVADLLAAAADPRLRRG